MPADHSLLKHDAESPFLSAMGQLQTCSGLGVAPGCSSRITPLLTPAAPCSKSAWQLAQRQHRNPKSRLPLHHMDRLFDSPALEMLLHLHTLDVIEWQRGIYTHTSTVQEVLPHPSSFSGSPLSSPAWFTLTGLPHSHSSPIHTSDLIQGVPELVFQTLVILTNSML